MKITKLIWMLCPLLLSAVTTYPKPLINVTLPDNIKAHYSLEDPRFEVFRRIVSEEKKKIFIETGTAGGEGVYRASMAGFAEIFTIEFCADIYEYSKRIFSIYPQIHQYLGDSATVLTKILPSIHEPAVFWLDAHYNGPRGTDSLGDVNDKCPLLRELKAIASHHIHTHTILIDDVRCFGTKDFDYLSLEKVMDAIHQINPNYEISFEAGYLPNDVLVARIPPTILSSVSLPKDVFLPTTNFPSSFPYVTGETFRHFSDHIFDPTKQVNPKEVKAGDTIFVFFDYLEYFFSNIHPCIEHPYILITHHFFGSSDGAVPGDKLAPFLDNNKLIAWFGINIDRIHPKLFALPIGIASPFYSYGNTRDFDWCISKKDHIKKNSLLYMNFAVHTYPKERQNVYDLFKNQPYCDAFLPDRHSKPPKTHQDFLLDLASHQFCLSPRGNGLDTFRTWEALLMGSFPIVKSSVIDTLYENLPIVIINDWAQVTEEFLKTKYTEMLNKNYNYEKLYIPYWINLINTVRAQAKG